MAVDFQVYLECLSRLYDSCRSFFFSRKIPRSCDGDSAYPKRGEKLPPGHSFAARITTAPATFCVLILTHNALLAYS
jgi:hypothetical protein